MSQNLRDIASEVAGEIYNHKLPDTADEFLDLLEPISENSFKLLTCFNNCKNLDEVFKAFSEQHISVSGSYIEESIFELGCYDDEFAQAKPPASIKPDWFVVEMNDGFLSTFRYFETIPEALEFTIQMIAISKMGYVVDQKDYDLDWKSEIQHQLAIAYAIIQWHTLGGNQKYCIDFILKTFCNEGVVLFKTIREYILENLIIESGFNKILYDYHAEFYELPCFYDLDQPERWKWFLPHLPDVRHR